MAQMLCTGSPPRFRNSQSHIPRRNAAIALSPHNEYRVATYLLQTKVCPNCGRYTMLVVAGNEHFLWWYLNPINSKMHTN